MHSGKFTFTSEISQHDKWACLDKGMQTSKHSKGQQMTSKGIDTFVIDDNTRDFVTSH